MYTVSTMAHSAMPPHKDAPASEAKCSGRRWLQSWAHGLAPSRSSRSAAAAAGAVAVAGSAVVSGIEYKYVADKVGADFRGGGQLEQGLVAEDTRGPVLWCPPISPSPHRVPCPLLQAQKRGDQPILSGRSTLLILLVVLPVAAPWAAELASLLSSMNELSMASAPAPASQQISECFSE